MKWISIIVIATSLAAASCGSVGKTPTSPACDSTCQDDVAVLALRDAMKLAYNLTLQGAPVGAQNAMGPCPLGGSVQISGNATSNSDQGTTMVNLTYVFDACAYSNVDTDATQNFDVTLAGTVTEVGVLAEEPSSTTALEINSASMSIIGTVYNPPIDYTASACAVVLGQNGSDVSGTLCGRDAGASL